MELLLRSGNCKEVVARSTEKEWKVAYDRLRRKCLFWLKGDHAAAEDLVSQTILKLLDSDNDMVLQDPYAWLSRIAWNLFIDFCRREQRNRVALEMLQYDATATSPNTSSAEEQLLSKEYIVQVEEMIDTLPQGIRQAFCLHVLDGVDYREVAKRLNITQPNARKRVQLARSALKESLRE